MLDFIRDRAHGWFAWAIIIAIIVPFALWGVNQYFSHGGENFVAQVNGVSISQAEYQDAYYRQRQRLQQLLGANFNPSLFPEERLKQQVIQDLVRRELMVQAAAGAGLRVSDEQLSAVIRNFGAFQKDGKFSSQQYEEVLRREGMSPGMFEAQMRRDLLTQQFATGVTDTAFATKSEITRYAELEYEKRDVGYMTVPAAQFAEQVKVGDDEIQAYYKEHAAQFAIPERVTAAYLELDLDKLADAIPVDDATLKARYESEKKNYQTPEERRARHILIAVPKGADKAADEAAQKKAEALVAKLRSGGDFAALAKKNSDDPGSASKGGELGFFESKDMDPAFAKAAFSLKKGDISDPIRSSFGYHIIQVEEIRGGGTKPFEAVKEQIKRDIQREKAEDVYYKKADQLANLTYEHPDSLDTAAEQLGLKIQETQPFSRSGGEGIASNRKFVDAAFSDDVLGTGHNSEAVELGGNRTVVLRVRDHLPKSTKPLEEVRAAIVESIKHNKSVELAAKEADGLAKRIGGGEDPKTVAGEMKLTWATKDGLGRGDTDPAQAVIDAVFKMPRPTGKAPSARSVALASGDQAVVALYAVHPGVVGKDESKASATVIRANSEAAFAGVVGSVTARAKIVKP